MHTRRPRRIRILLFLLPALLLCLLPAGAAAQDRAAEWERLMREPGRWFLRSGTEADAWRSWNQEGFVAAGWTRAQFDEAYRRLEAMEAVFRDAAALDPPIGAEIYVLRSVIPGCERPEGCRRPFQLRTWLHIFRPTRELEGESGLSVWITSPGLCAGLVGCDEHDPVAEDSLGAMYMEVPPAGEVHGHRFYDENTDRTKETVFLARPGRPARHVPVATERWLRHLVREHEELVRDLEEGLAGVLETVEAEPEPDPVLTPEQIEELRAVMGEEAAERQIEQMQAMREQVARIAREASREGVPEYRESLKRERARLATLRARLEGLSAAERGAPFHLYGPDMDPLTHFSAPSQGWRIVTPNPDYLDPDLPPTALQTIRVRFTGSSFGTWTNREFLHRVRDTVDWARLEALLAGG